MLEKGRILVAFPQVVSFRFASGWSFPGVRIGREESKILGGIMGYFQGRMMPLLQREKLQFLLHQVQSCSPGLLYLHASSRSRIPSSGCFCIAKMFARVFPAVLPGILTGGWLRPSSIFSMVASEALGFERLHSFSIALVYKAALVYSYGLLKAVCVILNFNLSLLQPLVSGLKFSLFLAIGETLEEILPAEKMLLSCLWLI